jgi:hypothetical protein
MKYIAMLAVLAVMFGCVTTTDKLFVPPVKVEAPKAHPLADWTPFLVMRIQPAILASKIDPTKTKPGFVVYLIAGDVIPVTSKYKKIRLIDPDPRWAKVKPMTLIYGRVVPVTDDKPGFQWKTVAEFKSKK